MTWTGSPSPARSPTGLARWRRPGAAPNARRSGRPVEEEIPERKQAAEGDIVCFGGARFAHSLARHRLIDEYRLTVHPVAPVSTTAYPDGVVTHVLAAKTEGGS